MSNPAKNYNKNFLNPKIVVQYDYVPIKYFMSNLKKASY